MWQLGPNAEEGTYGKRLLRRIFETRRDEVTGGCWKTA
jgi:hypothetical protein